MPSLELFNLHRNRLCVLYGNAALLDPSPKALSPGWHHISLPAGPINAVLGLRHSVSVVLTYDPTETGGWLSASRDEDGMFLGSLETIRAHLNYSVFAEAR